ncbi:hypothetical protein H6F95_27660 [Cyanobacteria bacterium FACHB-471]|nr:hypothetical protein [Cyanobacteria bacterium FACHB-471]
MHLTIGDLVRYVGSGAKIQQDYGSEDLAVVKVNATCMTVCQNQQGDLLIGARCKDLEVIERNSY